MKKRSRGWNWLPMDVRFELQIDRNGPVATNRPDLGRCWVWVGSRMPSGYGHIGEGGRTYKVHVWTYEQRHGPVPKGMQLDHFACDNPPCANPDHVRPVTPRENTLRSDGPAALNLAKTHCPANHPYDGENLYVKPNGQRNCRICRRTNDRERKRRLRLQMVKPELP